MTMPHEVRTQLLRRESCCRCLRLAGSSHRLVRPKRGLMPAQTLPLDLDVSAAALPNVWAITRATSPHLYFVQKMAQGERLNLE